MGRGGFKRKITKLIEGLAQEFEHLPYMQRLEVLFPALDGPKEHHGVALILMGTTRALPAQPQPNNRPSNTASPA